MKSSAQRVVGIVLSMMLGLVIQSRAQDRTVLVTEMRIGNVATQPGQAWYGDFEYDIGTNTAAPAAKGQFAWPNSNAVPFHITYNANLQYAWLQVSADPQHTIAYDLGSAPFTPAALANLQFGGRASQTDSSLCVSNLYLKVGSQEWVALTNVFQVLPSDGYKSGSLPGLNLGSGFELCGEVLLAWNPAIPPRGGHLAFQMAVTEPQQVVKVEWIEDNPEDDVGLQSGNPESHGGGMRFYVEKNRPDGPVHTKVKAVAKLLRPVPVGGAATVWFKVFDMDDPTFNETDANHVVDKNDEMDSVTSSWVHRGNDNRPNAGGLTARRKGTIAGLEEIQSSVEYEPVALAEGQDTAIVEYEVTAPRPGNNWKVVAHTDGVYLTDVEINTTPSGKGLSFRLISNPNENLPAAVQSPLLSVWRTIRIEFDRMPAPPATDVFGITNGVAAEVQALSLFDPGMLNATKNSLGGGVWGLRPGFIPEKLDLVLGYREIDRNDDGHLLIRSAEYLSDGHNNDRDLKPDGTQNVDEADEAVTLNPVPGPNANVWFAVNTDDPKWLTDLQPPAVADVLADMNRYYTLAYIRCVELNLDLNLRKVTEHFYRMTKAIESSVDQSGSASFWTACVIWAYESSEGKTKKDYKVEGDYMEDGKWVHHIACGQEFYDGDDDPEDEGVTNQANGPGVAPQSHVVSLHGGTHEVQGWTLIFTEVIRDLGHYALGTVVAHEVGHQFGLQHPKYTQATGFEPDKDGVMFWDPKDFDEFGCERIWRQVHFWEHLPSIPDRFSLVNIGKLRAEGNDISAGAQ